MKATSIVRRIDELGRVVIPKEIRKTLRLRVGDPIEIFTDKDQLILQKFSPLITLASFAFDICQTLAEQTEKVAFVCDLEKVIVVKGGLKDIDQVKIAQGLANALLDRKTILVTRSSGKQMQVLNSEVAILNDYLVVPIITAGDVIGGIVLVANNGQSITETDVRICQFASNFISKQFL